MRIPELTLKQLGMFVCRLSNHIRPLSTRRDQLTLQFYYKLNTKKIQLIAQSLLIIQLHYFG